MYTGTVCNGLKLSAVVLAVWGGGFKTTHFNNLRGGGGRGGGGIKVEVCPRAGRSVKTDDKAEPLRARL